MHSGEEHKVLTWVQGPLIPPRFMLQDKPPDFNTVEETLVSAVTLMAEYVWVKAFLGYWATWC